MAQTTTHTDWTVENEYWRQNYRHRPYADAHRDYDTYEPGYRFGFESARRVGGKSWDDAENDLQRSWDTYEYRGKSTWQEVKDAVRDAWERARASSRS